MTKSEKEIEVDWDQVHQTIFVNAAFNYTKWVCKAVDLLVTAKKLEPDIIDLWDKVERCLDDTTLPTPADYLQESFYMVVSFAVENLLKAKLIQHKEEKYRRDFHKIMKSDLSLSKKLKKVFPNELKTHDLFLLSEMVGLSVDISEESLLRRLSHNATWAGRYPTALNHVDLQGLACFSNGKTYSLRCFGSKDLEAINKFVNSLPDRLELFVSHDWPIK